MNVKIGQTKITMTEHKGSPFQKNGSSEGIIVYKLDLFVSSNSLSNGLILELLLPCFVGQTPVYKQASMLACVQRRKDKTMILVIDIGNTNIVLGVYQQEKLQHFWRLSTNHQATTDEYGAIIHNLFIRVGLAVTDIEGVIISSVVPAMVSTIQWLCHDYLYKTPLIVDASIVTGLNIRCDNPHEVGSDRLVNAVAAIDQYGGDIPLVVVDFGTATTFDVIDGKSNYLGGAIVPGIGISMEALYQCAAKLPRIELTKPKSVIGSNTVHSMQAGIIFGYAGQVDGIVDRISKELQAKPKVIATGGFAALIASESRSIDRMNPLLTLEGLRLIYTRNP